LRVFDAFIVVVVVVVIVIVIARAFLSSTEPANNAFSV